MRLFFVIIILIKFLKKNETLINEYARFLNEIFKKKEEIYLKKNNVKKNYKSNK